MTVGRAVTGARPVDIGPGRVAEQLAERPCRLSALEITSGTVLGHVAPADNNRCRPALEPPLQALENAVLPALLRGPCLVSFSGGMDSSFVLAVATRTARRRGLADPVPITWRFTDAPLAMETAWQDRILDTLQIKERVVLQAADELDFLGPVAERLLRRYGVLFPANLHVHLPLLDQAVGGSFLTGVGGDQILTCWAGTSSTFAQRLRGPLPDPLRIRWQQRRGHDPYPWLWASVSRDILRRRRCELKSRPPDPQDRPRWWTARRDLTMTCRNLDMVGRHDDVQVINPLLDDRFHAALGVLVGSRRGVDRAAVLAAVAGDELPPELAAYRPKARFGQVFLRRHTREFLRNWNGTGVVESLIDPVALRSEWSARLTSTATAMLLQSVWVNQSRSAGKFPQCRAVPDDLAGVANPIRYTS